MPDKPDTPQAQKWWSCLIGPFDPGLVPDGADLPMRKAVEAAAFILTGQETSHNFSGWGVQPDEYQRAVIEDREPQPELTCGVHRRDGKK